VTQQGPDTQGPLPTATAGGAPSSGAKPRVLFAEGGRISRSTASDTIRQRFDIREAADAEAAWQAVLLDSSVRIVVADLSSDNARGHELLTRVRGSKVQRIREMPAIALVRQPGGSATQATAGLDVTELLVGDVISGETGAQLLARLRVLVELSSSRDSLSENRNELDSARTVDPDTELLTLAAFDRQVDKLLSYARRALSDLALICIRIELSMTQKESWDGEVEQRMKLVGRALGASIRMEDLACRSDTTEFCVATQNNGMTDMLQFAARLRKILENVDAAGPGVDVWTCIGVATLSEELRRTAPELRGQSQKRAQVAQTSRSRRIILGASESGIAGGVDPRKEAGSMDVSLALALIGSGRSAEVIPHLPRLFQHLNPLIRLMRQQQQQEAAANAAASAAGGEGKPPA